jgi:hypothetical protein
LAKWQSYCSVKSDVDTRGVVKLPEFFLFLVGLLLTAWGIWALVAAVENYDPNSEIPGWAGWVIAALLLVLGVSGLTAAWRIYRGRSRSGATHTAKPS